MKNTHYSELMNTYKDYDDLFVRLYRLHTYKEEEVDEIYQEIKKQLLETKMFTPIKLISILYTAAKFNNRYLRSYFSIFKKIFDEYHITTDSGISSIFLYFLNMEYGIQTSGQNNTRYNLQKLSLDVFEENTIYRAIMEDDIEKFMLFTESEDFDPLQTLRNDLFSDFFGDSDIGFVDLCSYYGAVKCFKFLITEFKCTPSYIGLKYSFLGGNPDIVHECLKQHSVNRECMEFAIASHNIDFVCFLMNEYGLEVFPHHCGEYNNLQAFFVYLDNTNDINTCFANSPLFNIPSLCEYFISHGADINAKNYRDQNALHIAARSNNVKITEFLISNGIDINSLSDLRKLPLHIAAEFNSYETEKILLSYYPDINVRDAFLDTALDLAAQNNCTPTAKLLISHGADVNIKDGHS